MNEQTDRKKRQVRGTCLWALVSVACYTVAYVMYGKTFPDSTMTYTSCGCVLGTLALLIVLTDVISERFLTQLQSVSRIINGMKK